MERAVFGASEFFSKEALSVRGVEYIQTKNLTETNVELIEIWFNPWKVSYDELLELFFDLHDPTDKTGQKIKGQSFIYFANVNQLHVAKQKKLEQKQIWRQEIITELVPIWKFNRNEGRLIS
ncbi:peptide-methionine (S)-S-oxide reductase [Metabacillus malikii]|uniref:peptide-methionine (S)-S-oxide reductase n=1 Tax=Metabacillus malikii TaxID=1504265 RepID=A0ABT9ZI76_9BACI|nr:peptide-methionine (S)-S-oxide reductase [Metabacillus malikii]MDQ0231985.1 peptide-methionine (S)-S-oxide reductase [Metabacillus malikii]